MTVVTRSTIVELIETFDKLHKMLVKENEQNWIRGIESIRDRLASVDSSTDIDQLFRQIRSSYKGMHGGPGSFTDFLLWRDDFEERKKVNKEFEVLANKAWQLLGLD